MVITDYKMREIRSVESPLINIEQLQHIAFNGDYRTVYSLVSKIPPDKRRNITDKYILFETITGSVDKLNNIVNLHDEFLLIKEKKFLLDITNQFITVCSQSTIFPRHLFLGIIKVCKVLIQLSEFNLA